MRRTLIAAAISLGLAALAADAQVNQLNLPANTVVGRLGIGSGPSQAVPLATLLANQLNGLCATAGAFPIFNATTGLWTCSTAGGAGSQAALNGGQLTIDLGSGSGAPASLASTGFELLGANTTNPKFEVTSWGVFGSFVARAVGGTRAAPTVVTNGNSMGEFDVNGWDGTAFGLGGSDTVYAEGNWTSTSHPGMECWETVAVNSTTNLSHLCQHHDGGLTLDTVPHVLTNPGNGIFDVLTGFQINNSAPSGHYLRGNGTNYVDGIPACGDLSNAAPSCSTDATNANNISSGTLGAARLPNPSASTLGGIESYATVSHQWINTISTSGVPSSTQPAVGDINGFGTGVATALGNATNATGGPVTATTGCASWTPTDQSGASLTFTSVSAQYCQYGNIVFAYGTLTYPTTANGSNAAISLPVAVPNQSYAVVQSTLIGGVSGVLRTVQNSSTAAIYGLSTSQLTNTNLSTATIHFILVYPAT